MEECKLGNQQKITKFWNMSRSSAILAGKTKNTAQINIHGTIGTSWWDESVSASQFAKDLMNLGDIDEITVSLNSGGGSVFDGLAIRSTLKNHKAWVIMRVDGWAASIASIIMTAGDEIIVSLGSQVMIHNPMNSVFGNAEELRKQADVLDHIRDSLIEVYQSKTTLSKEELIDMMNKETWMSADEAVFKGFADRTERNTAVALSMMGAVAMVNGVQMDLSGYKRPPKNTSPSITGVGSLKISNENTFMSREILDSQRIEQLKQMRTPRNSHIIDAAIKNGQDPGYTALEIVRGGYHLSDEEASQAIADAVGAEMRALSAKRSSL
jgi:ATP-dependent Clp protease protease subunit